MNTKKYICEICGIKEAHYYLPKLKIWCCKKRKDECKGPPKPNICKVCGKKHDGTYGNGEFCSRKCVAKFNLDTGRNSEKYKIHIADISWRGFHRKIAPFGHWKCNNCEKIFRTRKELIEHNKQFHPEKIKEKGGGWLRGHNKNEPGFEWLKEKAKRQSEKIRNGEMKPSFKGKHHTKKTRELLSKKHTEYLLNNFSTGRRPDVKWYECPNINGESFKHQGTWELEIAKWLNSKNILWIKRKTINYKTNDGITKIYIPDFYLPETNQYIEVKGWFSKSDKTKMNNVVNSNKNIEIFFIHGKKCLNEIIKSNLLSKKLIYKTK